MTREQRAELRRLYQQACFGAGAEPRREARTAIDVLCREAGVTLRDALDAAGLDMGAYFATRPIT